MLDCFDRTLVFVSKVSTAKVVWRANVLEKSRIGGASPAFGMIGSLGQVQYGIKVNSVSEVIKWLESDNT